MRFQVDYDDCSIWTLTELFADEGVDHTVTREQVEAMTIGQTINFDGGAGGLGTITRIQ